MKFVKSLKLHNGQSRAEFLCEVCGDTVVRYLANGTRDKSCGSKSCKITRRFLKLANSTKSKIAVYLRGDKIAVYSSQAETAKRLNIGEWAVSRALKKSREYKGYSFKIIEDS